MVDLGDSKHFLDLIWKQGDQLPRFAVVLYRAHREPEVWRYAARDVALCRVTQLLVANPSADLAKVEYATFSVTAFHVTVS